MAETTPIAGPRGFEAVSLSIAGREQPRERRASPSRKLSAESLSIAGGR